MMIVSLTRADLRGESVMADEAFALSPISARATLPGEEDYDAISHAFMETSRGRWFLGEYAKRNRNADTRMVLDAVARIEETIAAQKQPAAQDRLTEALATIRRAVDEAQAAATAAVESLASEENLAPVRKGARIVREISWRWREIGADARICDLLDSQVSAIEETCGQISSASPRAALSAAFDLVKERIAGFGDSDAAAPPVAEKAVASPSPAARDELPAAAAETVQPASPTSTAEAAIRHPDQAGVKTVEAAKITAEADDLPHEAFEVAAEAVDPRPESEDDYDDALLDMVALEMAAPDPAGIDEPSDAAADDIHVTKLPLAEPITIAREPETIAREPETIAREPEPIAAPAQPAVVQASLQPSLQLSPQPSPQSSPQLSLQTSPQTSLGSTLIANGIVRGTTASQPDPLAPIRRMSQAEKIAFFS
jgi:hypothetical protein